MVERPSDSRDIPPLRGAIVGFGAAANGHLSAYQRYGSAAIVAVVDPSPQRRATARALVPGVRTFVNLGELADQDEIDFVDVCSPPNWHAENVVEALQLGCHVICEKPLLASVSQYRDVLKVLADAPGMLYPCHNYKFAPVFRLMRSIVATPDFGDVVSGRFTTRRTRHAAGVPEWRPDWRRDATIAGGGIITDHGTHSIYLATHVTGLPLQSVACVTERCGRSRFTGTEDTAFLTLELARGARIRVELTWAATARHTSYAVGGERETLLVDGDRFIRVTAEGATESTVPSDFDDPTHAAWFHSMFEDFRCLIDDPSQQSRLLDEAFQTAVAVRAAYESAASGGHAIAVSEQPWRSNPDAGRTS